MVQWHASRGGSYTMKRERTGVICCGPAAVEGPNRERGWWAGCLRACQLKSLTREPGEERGDAFPGDVDPK